MKTTMRLLCVASLLLWCGASAVQAQEKTGAKTAEVPAAKPEAAKPDAPKTAGPAMVTLMQVKGSVEVKPSADAAWQKAKTGMKVGSDWWISTGLRGQAVLKFEDNSIVVVQRLTEMTISKFSREKGTVKTHLKMKYGAVRVHVKKGTARNEFRVACPTATASVQGTKIQEFSYFKGLGSKILMGNEGTAKYGSQLGSLNVGSGEGTNDELLDPAVTARMKAWVPVTFSGFTKQEQNAAVWHGTVGAVVWQNLVPQSQTPPPPPPPPEPPCPPDPGDPEPPPRPPQPW